MVMVVLFTLETVVGAVATMTSISHRTKCAVRVEEDPHRIQADPRRIPDRQTMNVPILRRTVKRILTMMVVTSTLRILLGVVVTTTPTSNQTKCAARAEVVNNNNTFHINQQRFASTPTTTTSTPMDILAPTSTFSTTTKTSRTTVTHKLTHRSSPRPVCAALVEGASLGFVELYQAMSNFVVKTLQPKI